MKVKKIVLALFVGIIALSSAGLSISLAWYINSNQLKVETIQIEISGDSELLISTDDQRSHAKVSLTDQELSPKPVLFAPVTSAHSSLWLNQKKETPTFYDDTLFFSDEFDVSVATGGYFSKELYLFSDRDVYVTIDNYDSGKGTYIVPDETANNNLARDVYEKASEAVNPTDSYYRYKGKTVSEIKSMLDELAKAMRFSILIPQEDKYDYVIIDPHKEEETLLGGLLDNNNDHYYDYYPNDGSYQERLYGEIVNKDKAVYDDPLATDSDYKIPPKEGESEANVANIFNAKHKKGVRPFNLDQSINNGLQIKVEDSHSLDEFSNHAKTPLNIPVYRDRANKIVLSIYLEGWDLESVNHTMGASFLSSIKFVIGKGLY